MLRFENAPASWNADEFVAGVVITSGCEGGINFGPDGYAWVTGMYQGRSVEIGMSMTLVPKRWNWESLYIMRGELPADGGRG